MKQAIIIRKDLKLSIGKTAAQAAHACVSAYKKSSFIQRNLWEIQGQKKVVLRTGNEKELIDIYNKAKAKKLPCSLITDAGRTQIKAGTKTAVGIGPAKDEKIDELVGNLKLL